MKEKSVILYNKTGTNLKSPQKRKDKKRREMEAQGLEGKNNECRLNNERMKETGQKRCYEIGFKKINHTEK